MLVLPQINEPYRIVSIDPGTNTLGVALLEVDLVYFNITLLNAFTLNSGTNIHAFPTVLESHGERYTKLFSHSQNLLIIFNQYHPHSVICESPFLGRFPQAFEALVECKIMIRNALLSHDPSMPLETVDPPTAKLAVGAPGRGGDKEVVKKAILNLDNLVLPNVNFIESLDEHSIDAIAVGYYKAKQVIEWMIRNGEM